MSDALCSREPHVLRAVARGWSGDADGEVARHAAECPRCGAVRAAAELLRDEHMRLAQATHVPTAAAMWWRLDRRLRDERVARLQRVALATQAITLAASAGAAVAVFQMVAPWIAKPGSGDRTAWEAALAMLTAWPPTTWIEVASAWALPLALAAAVWMLLVPAVLYLGLADE
jgi:sugar phosphate isomerase/epimerase